MAILQIRNKSQGVIHLRQISQAARSGPDPDAKACSTGQSTSLPLGAPREQKKTWLSKPLIQERCVSMSVTHHLQILQEFQKDKCNGFV